MVYSVCSSFSSQRTSFALRAFSLPPRIKNLLNMLVGLFPHQYNFTMPAKPVLKRRARTLNDRLSKSITLSRVACVLLDRASRASGLTHSGFVEYLIRRDCEEMIARDKEVLKNATT